MIVRKMNFSVIACSEDDASSAHPFHLLLEQEVSHKTFNLSDWFTLNVKHQKNTCLD